jgi:hypothetical protein
MAKKAPVTRVSEKRATVEREAIRKAIDETEAPTKVEIAQAGKRPAETGRPSLTPSRAGDCRGR